MSLTELIITLALSVHLQQCFPCFVIVARCCMVFVAAWVVQSVVCVCDAMCFYT